MFKGVVTNNPGDDRDHTFVAVHNYYHVYKSLLTTKKKKSESIGTLNVITVRYRDSSFQIHLVSPGPDLLRKTCVPHEARGLDGITPRTYGTPTYVVDHVDGLQDVGVPV